jgi:transposase InsO family protein
MNEKIEFAMKCLTTTNFRQLCRAHGISAKTGYKWKERFINNGLEGLEDESRRPQGHSEQLPESVVCEMVLLKQAHPHWGPRKIRGLYERRHPGAAPSESSFKRILEQAGLTKPRRIRRSVETGRIASGRKATGPNDVWTADFKGWWTGEAGERVEPLTVRDEFSRMLLEMRAVRSGSNEVIRPCFERLFEAHGLPGAIRSDNGPPFASSNAILGLSRLSVWWLALGIDLERSRPGCPQDNGAHERMHLDISRELQGGRIGRDQNAFDIWRHEYNTERPHEALEMKCPAEVYQPSGRPYEGTPDQLDYGGMETRKVHRKDGTIGYRSEKIRLTAALAGWNVGLAEQPDGQVEVWFASLLLGRIDPQTRSFRPTIPARGAAASAHSGDSATLHRPNARCSPHNAVQPTPHL